MSFALTEAQLLDGSKDVTRRLGWKNLRVGETLTAIRKGMGLGKGERQVVLGTLVVRSVSFEQIDEITLDDVRREGFPNENVEGFVDFFCRANGCKPEQEVTRIEFAFIRAPSPEP
jgi:hypothetical protein